MSRPLRSTQAITMIAASIVCFLAPALVHAEDHPASMMTSMESSTTTLTFDGMGATHRTITTSSPEAQKFFDQGLAWMWSFNLEEAQRSFEQAEKLDPSCAMCAWGTAFSLGPHINLPALPERTVAANKAAMRALALKSKASPVEQALIDAMVKRYSDPAPSTPEGQHDLDQAYADAMKAVAKRFPKDDDVQAIWVESMMDLHPWDFWKGDGTAEPWTPEIVSTLEALLARNPNHAGANHYYIHAVEASPHPEKGLDAAQRLQTMVPTSGHMVHMPSHIYKRIGRYEESAKWNRRAITADSAYRAKANPHGFYMMYIAHNQQFLMATCWMEGRAAEAMTATRAALAEVPPDMLTMMPGFDLVLGYPVWTMARFGQWDNLLAEPAPPEGFAYAKAVWHCARGIAYTTKGQLEQAKVERDSMTALGVRIPDDANEGNNSAHSLFDLATNLLDAEMAAKRGDNKSAAAAYEKAVLLEDGLRYDEPSDWYYPVRHHYGAFLLATGQAAQAEKVYRADLVRNPENGWALNGLAMSLKAQKKDKDAAPVEARAAKAWKNADTKIASSRL
jgi:tetratricopeptide (TPR) repeat protein